MTIISQWIEEIRNSKLYKSPDGNSGVEYNKWNEKITNGAQFGWYLKW